MTDDHTSEDLIWERTESDRERWEFLRTLRDIRKLEFELSKEEIFYE